MYVNHKVSQYVNIFNLELKLTNLFNPKGLG
jgi:hypothetical protein